LLLPNIKGENNGILTRQRRPRAREPKTVCQVSACGFDWNQRPGLGQHAREYRLEPDASGKIGAKVGQCLEEIISLLR
jgi:hypothetical protein